MSSTANEEKSRLPAGSQSFMLLRKTGLVALVAGAAGSLILMSNAVEHPPAVLVILFTGWVLSPFAGLFTAHMLYKKRPVSTRVTIYVLMLLIAVGSLVGYSGVFIPPGTKPAAVYLMVPLASWLVMIITIPMALRSGRMSREGNNT
jgi:hypothetical protein